MYSDVFYSVIAKMIKPVFYLTHILLHSAFLSCSGDDPLYGGSWGDVCCRHLSENNQWSIMSLFKISENNTEPGRISGECFGIRFTLTHSDDTREKQTYWELNCTRRVSPHFLFQQFCKFKKNTLFVSDEKKCQCNENLHSRSRSFHLLLHFIKIRFSKNISNKITFNKVRWRYKGHFKWC